MDNERERETLGSGVEVFVLHVKAAGGTQERLAGAVGALALQTLRRLRGPCGGGGATDQTTRLGKEAEQNILPF